MRVELEGYETADRRFDNGEDAIMAKDGTCAPFAFSNPIFFDEEVYNFTVYMEAEQTEFAVGDIIYIDVMLKGDINYTQLNTVIAYDANIFEFAGYANLSGLAAEVKKDGVDKIAVRSVPFLNMMVGASCVTPIRVATLKFTVKDNFSAESIATDLAFASIVVTPAAGVTEVKTAPGNKLNFTLSK